MIRRILLLSLLVAGLALGQQNVMPEREASLKAELATQIDGMKKQAQVMVDSVFSFGELGFQEQPSTLCRGGRQMWKRET